MVTSGQPMPTAAGPAQRQAVVVEDDRAGQDEMMLKLIAKLLNPPIERYSSCA